jgi:hypothetical protein
VLFRSKLRSGDTVFLVIESHVLNFGQQGSRLLGTDADPKLLGGTSIPVESISQHLEEVTAEGCLLLLLLDGIHDQLPVETRRDMNNWVRDLNRRGVIVLLASQQDASQTSGSLGAFAQAVLDSVTVAGRLRPQADPAAPPTLGEFQESVISRVSELTGRRQFAGFYHPEFLDRPDRIRIFEPQTPLAATLAGK